jgi:TolA-binding protein
MASLVEASHDGRLGEKEQASLTRHLTSCGECREHATELRRLRELARAPRSSVAPLQHQRGRVRLLQEAALGPRAARPSRWTALAVAAALAMAVGGVAFGAASSGRAPAPKVVAPVRASVGALDLTVVAPEPGTSFSRAREGGLDRVTLAAGTVHIRVHHLRAGQRFLVRTEDAEVEVRGTRFDVDASAGRLTHVRVTEGVVELRRGGETRLLPAGAEWTADPPAPPSSSDVSPPVASPSSGGASASAASPSAGSPSAASPSAASASASHAPPPGAAPDDDAAFRAGMSRIEKGDFGQAASDLHTFAAQHPDDPRAEDAAFLEALSLSRAGRADDAAEAARRYLARYPNGYRRAEAEKLLAR